MPPDFSRRTRWDRAQNRLSLALSRRRETGNEILDLTETNPTRCGISYPVKELLDPLSDPGNLVYDPDPRGIPHARAAVAGYYAEKGIAVSPERIFLVSGTSEAYSFILRLLCDPRDRISVPRPGYPLLDHLSELNDAEVTRHDFVRENGGWRLDERSLRESLERGRPKAVLAVNPGNPTGHFYSGPERAFLAALLRKSGAAIIADEVFIDYIHGKGRPESFASGSQVLTFTLGGVSKMLGLPQMKLSWIVITGPEPEVEEACARLEVIADAYLSVNTPVQRSFGSWMKLRNVIQSAIVERLRCNRTLLGKLASRGSGVEAMFGDGGWHAVLRVAAGGDDEALALGLVQHEGVVVQPGYLFDFTDGTYLVTSLLTPPDEFERGARLLVQAVGAA